MPIINIKALLGIIAACIVSNALPLRAQLDLPYAPGRLLVRLKGSSKSTKEVAAAGLSEGHLLARSSTKSPSTPESLTQLYHITDGTSVEDKIEELKAMSGVQLVEPDYQVRVQALPPDAQISQQWHLHKIDSSTAWAIHTGSRKVKVCVIDSGVRIDHPDLAGNIIKGWNLVPEDQETPGPGPEPTEPHFYNFNDTLGHGTHVAGILGALGNNTLGVAGTSWKVGIMACRFIWDMGSGYVSDAIRCMELCQEAGADIYNNSWGDVRDKSEVLLSAIKDIQAANGLFVVAAGNNGLNMDITPVYPGAFNTTENLLSVAATDEKDAFAGFTNYGRQTVHLAAPGVRIHSTTYNGGYGLMSGTSMACPVVAGVSAVLQSMALASGTRLTPKQIISILTSTVDPLSGGAAKLKSGGRLNFAKAVAKLKPTLPAPLSPSPVPKVSPSPPPKAPASPSPPPGKTFPPPPPVSDPSSLLPPVCGTSVLKGLNATQSSTYASREAVNAVNGDCRTNATAYSSACSSTSPNEDNPWWTVDLPTRSKVVSVSLTSRSDCCWDTIATTKVLLGNATWNGPSTSTQFIECGQVAASGVNRGLRIIVKCPTPIVANSIAVYLPKETTSLSLCEVDASILPL